MIRYVLFDLDGTLLDTIGDLTEATDYALRTLGYPEHSEDAVRGMVGDGMTKLLERALPREGKRDLDRAVALFSGWYREHAADRTVPYDGIPETVRELSARDFGLAVVSNKPQFAVTMLARRFFPSIGVCVGAEPGRSTKPAPDMCNLAMLALGAPREECVYVGDSDTDLMTAKNVGIPCIGAAWGYRGKDFLRAHGAQTIADAPADLIDSIGGIHAL